jgi:putative membrane protein
MKLEALGETILTSTAFAGIGLVVFGIAFWVMEKITPFSIRKEIEDDQNTALAVIMAGVTIGIAIIIGAAIHG